MHDEEEIHGAGMWILRPSALDHRDQISHGHNDRDPEARFSKPPRARLTTCSLYFLIPMTLEMCLPSSEGRASILREGCNVRGYQLLSRSSFACSLIKTSAKGCL